MKTSRCIVVLLPLILCLGSLGRASDWPAHRHDVGRSAVTDETLAFPLQPAWRYVCDQAPRPAWPEPPRKINQMDFDYAPSPVIAGGLVVLGSSADDTIRALDAATGVERWHFITGGPVRFAPQIESNRVYAASDDGRVYCLDAATGKPVWTFDAAPANEMYVGNRRMISRWPIRTGVLVRDGVVYAVAGSWATEGTYAYALDAATGRLVWCNNEGGLQARGTGLPWRIGDPHMGEFCFTGPTPQGALLASLDCLIVPMGLNSPATYSLATGALLRYTPLGGGGTWNTLDGPMRYNFVTGEKNEGMFLWGGSVPDKGVVSKSVTIPVGQVPQFSFRATRFPFQSHGRGKVCAIIHDGTNYVRRAYGLALAGGTLLVGEDGAVAAVDPATDKELWRAPVDGAARELAVAGGRLYVATDLGVIYCFAPGKGAGGNQNSEVSSQKEESRAAISDPSKIQNLKSKISSLLEQAGMGRGFALVFGDPEGAIARELVGETELHAILPVVGEAAAGALRERLLATRQYGTRLHVVAVAGLDSLPFAQYVANAIVVAGPAPGLAGREMGRLLRPCGGMLLAPGLAPTEAEALCRQATNAEACSLVMAEGRASVRRGPLPGARDWDANVAGDRRVAWPLRPLWYGGPDSADVMHISGAHQPVIANGRYYVTGQDVLTAVDAYNGTTLWTRPIPDSTPGLRRFDGLEYVVTNGISNDYVNQERAIKRRVVADGSNVYLRLGEQFVGGTNDVLIQLDARTGEQLRYFGPHRVGPRIALPTTQVWTLALGPDRGGTVALEAVVEGLRFTLATRAPTNATREAWDLHFDFRPEAQRYGLYGKGTFMVTVYPVRAAGVSPRVEPGTGARQPALTVAGQRVADGTTTTVLLPWAEVGRLTGTTGRPPSFGFAATLNAWTGESDQVITQQHLFGDALAPGLNNGWATLVLAGGVAPAVGTTVPAVVGGGWDARPKTWSDVEPWLPPYYMVTPGEVAAAVRTAPRRHPLTGEFGPLGFRTGTGQCGNPVYAARMQIGRSTKIALGFYDFVEDGGLHFFPGVGPNCGVHSKAVNAAAALGLVLLSESRGHCDCMIPIRTSIAFAPAERRLNEDWALFCERDADAPVRRLAVNLGAFGDRRAADGTLWLSLPREAGGKAYPTEPGSRRYAIEAPPQSGTLQLPVSVGYLFELRPGRYSHNADRLVVSNTAIPWVYASGYAGITSVVVRLRDPAWLVATPAAVAPVLDGRPDDPAWSGATQAVLPFTRTVLRLRHDSDALHVSAWRPPILHAKGGAEPWTAATTGEDAEVWADDALEVFIGDARGIRVMHLGVSASGARYDALAASTGLEDRAWSAPWRGAAAADSNGFGVELAIPWKTLADAGLDRATLTLNAQMDQRSLANELIQWGTDLRFVPEPEQRHGIPEPLQSLGPAGRARAGNLVPIGLGAAPVVPPRHYTLRLHCADPVATNAPGGRVFDIRVQGQSVIEAFDLVKEAGGPRRAVVKEFKGIAATDTLTVEFVPRPGLMPDIPGKPPARPKPVTRENAPLLCGLEVWDEAYEPTVPGQRPVVTR